MKPDKAFSDLIGAIYDCALDSTQWADVLARITDVLGGELGDLTVLHPLSGTVQVAALYNWPADLTQRVQAKMAINPAAPLILTAPLDEPMCTSRDLDIESFHRSRYWKETFDGLGYSDYLTAVISRTPTSGGSWGVLRRTARGPYEDAALALARMLSPHIRRAVEISGLLGHQQVRSEALESALNALSAAAFICGPNGVLEFVNTAAENELERGSLFRESSGRLVGATTQTLKLMGEVLETTIDHQNGRDAQLEDADGRIFYANWVRLEASSGTNGRYLLFLRQPEPELVHPVMTAAKAYRLTSSEIQVLAQVLNGLTLIEIAILLGVARSTVKTHLDRIFRKTGTRRQTELVRLVLELRSPLNP